MVSLPEAWKNLHSLHDKMLDPSGAEAKQVCPLLCSKVILKHLIYVEFSVMFLWVIGSGEQIGT